MVGSTAASGATVAITEAARRAGIDRHAEAGLVENLYAEEFARRNRFSVVEDGSSVYAADNGTDKVLVRGSERLNVQVKHWETDVSDATLAQYPDVDRFASSGGFNPDADLSAHDMKGLTYDDLPVSAKARLEGTRVKNGAAKGLIRVKNAILGAVQRIVDGAKWVGNTLIDGAKSTIGQIIRSAKSAAGWYFQLSFGSQALVGVLAVAVISGAAYLLWEWSLDDERSSTSGATPIRSSRRTVTSILLATPVSINDGRGVSSGLPSSSRTMLRPSPSRPVRRDGDMCPL
jgi:hypothetical protein